MHGGQIRNRRLYCQRSRPVPKAVLSKAKSFVNELRKRYDMAFAAFVVDSMRKQNMLKDEKIAELLKDNPDER